MSFPVYRTDFGSRPLWTTEPPTEYGVYYAMMKNDPNPEKTPWIVLFQGDDNHYRGGSVYEFGAEDNGYVDEYTHWLGPLIEPEPPK